LEASIGDIVRPHQKKEKGKDGKGRERGRLKN
jgi:hypothetical protein